MLLTGISGAEEMVAPALEKPADEAKIEPCQILVQPDRVTLDYVRGYFTDSGRMLAAPLNWSGGDWVKAGLVIGVTSGIYFADAEIRTLARRNQSLAGDKGAAAGNIIGNPFYTLPALGLFYLYGNAYQDPKARRASLLAVESLVISGALSLGIKLATQRPRPFTGEAPNSWNGPGLKNRDPSFPSIHAQSAFSIASVIAEEYGNNQFVPPIAYGLATLTGISRIYNDKHWASDVFFGGAIGYFVGKAVVSYHTAQKDTSLKLLPTVSRQVFGLTAEYRF